MTPTSVPILVRHGRPGNALFDPDLGHLPQIHGVGDRNDLWLAHVLKKLRTASVCLQQIEPCYLAFAPSQTSGIRKLGVRGRRLAAE